jgi:RNA polymerase sigma-70 factor (ECF subfamily)
MSSLPPDEHVSALVEKIQRGDDREDSCREIHRLFYPVIRSFYAKRGFPHDEREDLTQTVFLRVFAYIGGLRDPKWFRCWVFEIAASVYRNELRHWTAAMREGVEESIDDPPETADSGRFRMPPSLASREPDALSEAVRRERHAALQQAVRGLPRMMSHCAKLRFCEGLKYQEIAVVMGISIQTVKAHIHEAKKRLAKALFRNGPE